jgi:chromosome segregation ATPase
MVETLDQKYERLKKNCEESHIRTNKLLCERDPLRNEKYGDRKAKIQYNLSMIQHRLNRLQEETGPLLQKKAKLEADLKKVIADHENYEDHQFYIGAPLTSITFDAKQEIAELQKELAMHEGMSRGIKERIAKLQFNMSEIDGGKKC